MPEPGNHVTMIQGGSRGMRSGDRGVALAAGQVTNSSQEMEDVAELLRLKDTDPEEFERYVQMASDAAKLAKEQPDVFAALLAETEPGVTGEDTPKKACVIAKSDMDKDVGVQLEDLPQSFGNPHYGEHQLSAARTEQLRARGAASEFLGSRAQEGELKLPGGGKLGSGGVKEQPQGVIISPRPGFVLKTKVLESGVKVFINVCQHERIGESGLRKKLDDTGKEVEGLNIPMSVGPPSIDKDNAGADCVVYDVVINPKAVEECKSDRTGMTRDWVCHLAIHSIMTKHKCTLDRKYKLPKLTFKGDKETGPPQQRIRDDSAKAHIQELDSTKSTSRHESSPSSSVPRTSPPPMSSQAGAESQTAHVERKPELCVKLPLTELDWRISAVWAAVIPDQRAEREEDVSGLKLEDTVCIPWERWPDSLVLTVVGIRPDAISSTDVLSKVEVQASAFECTVVAAGHYPLQVRLPYAILQHSASARANAHEKKITVILAVDKACPGARPDPGSKPWLLARALDSDEIGMVPKSVVSARESLNGDMQEDALPEDRFHLKMPKGVDPYTGIPTTGGSRTAVDEPVQEDEPLPEERFHRADVVSQHMIECREQQRKDKMERAEVEREERKKHSKDGVEYVDLVDYRAGGKFGPPVATKDSTATEARKMCASSQKELLHMDAASRILEESVRDATGKPEGNPLSRLSSSGWSELLD